MTAIFVEVDLRWGQIPHPTIDAGPFRSTIEMGELSTLKQSCGKLLIICLYKVYRINARDTRVSHSLADDPLMTDTHHKNFGVLHARP